MNKNIAKGSLGGGKGSWSVDLVEGNVQGSVSYSSDEVGVSASFTVKSKAGLEELKKLIPGSIDDVVISVIESALGL